MAFNPKKCMISTVYCGNEDKKYPFIENDNIYTHLGTAHQCMKKGFGAATAIANKKNLPKNSLQQIKYVGPKFESAFKENKINNIPELLEFSRKKTIKQLEKLLNKVFLNSNDTLNVNGFNSTLLFLYRNGNNRLPSCVENQN